MTSPPTRDVSPRAPEHDTTKKPEQPPGPRATPPAPQRNPGPSRPPIRATSIPRLLAAFGRQSARAPVPRDDGAGQQAPFAHTPPDATARDDAGSVGSVDRDRVENVLGSRSRPGSADVDAIGGGLAPGAAVIGYLTVTDDDRVTGEGAEAIDVVCRHAGWELLEIVRDRDDGTRTLQRPGLTYALRQIAMGHARALVVANAKHMSRSIVDLGALMDVFRDGGAVLIALDLGMDTSTPAGRQIAAVVGTLGAWERERIVRRTSAGLNAARSEGRRVGRPGIKDQPALGQRITTMRADGMTLQEIADELNAEGVPTVRGGRLWRPSSVQTALGYRRPRSGTPQARLPREWNRPDDETRSTASRRDPNSAGSTN